MKKNPHYWRAGEPHLDEIEFRPITDSSTRVAALRNGDIDMLQTKQPGDIDELKADFTVTTDFDSEKNYVQVNMVDPGPQPAADQPVGDLPAPPVVVGRGLAPVSNSQKLGALRRAR